MISNELLIGIAIFALGLYALIRDYKFFLYLLIFASVFIHKELFSLQMWDFLPIRFLMAAVFVYVLGSLLRLAYTVLFKKDNSQALEHKAQLSVYLKDPFVLLLTLLWLVRGVSIVFSADIRSSIELYAFFTSIYFAAVFIYVRLKNQPDQVLNYLDFYVFLVFVLCVFGFVQLLLNRTYGVTIGAFWQIPGHIPRVGSLFWDVNHFGAFISSLFLYGCARVLAKRVLKRKVLFGLYVLPVPIILYLTNSRSSMLMLASACCAFAFVLIFRYVGKKTYVLMLSAALVLMSLLFVIYSLDGSPLKETVNKNIHYRIDSFDSHFLLLSGTMEVFKDHPVLGGGYGSFYEQFLETEISSEYLRRDPAGLNTKVPAHTIWGETAAETGFVGFAVFGLFCVLILLVPLYNALNAASYKDYFVHAAIFATIVGYYVAGIFYSYNSEFFWLVIVLYSTYSIAKLSALTHYMPNMTTANLPQAFTWGHVRKAFLYLEDKMSLGFLVLTLVSGFLIFVGLGSRSLIAWDEAIYGKIAKNILDSGDWMTLTWKSATNWFEKPPLYFWTTAFFMKVFGVSEFTVRLTSALSGLGTILVTTYFAKKVFGRTVGYLSGFILLTTFQFLYYSRTGMLDVTLTFFMTSALVVYYARQKTLVTFMVTGLFVGLAVMTKGIVGFLPLGIILVADLLTLPRAKKPSALLHLIYVFVFSAYIFLLWHIYMLASYGTKFYDSYIVYHVLQRASTSIEGKGQPFWWYLVVLKVSMRIWFIVLLGALPFTVLLVVFRKKFEKMAIYLTKPEVSTAVMLLIWFAFIFFFFSSAVSKLIWYIMPIYPPAAIISAFGLVVLLRATFTFVSKKYASELVALTAYLIVLFALSYFMFEKDKVYVSDFNHHHALILKEANESYIDKRVLVSKIDTPVVLFYREGPYEEVSSQRILSELQSSPTSPLLFITTANKLSEFEQEFPTILRLSRSGDFVLATYSVQ